MTQKKTLLKITYEKTLMEGEKHLWNKKNTSEIHFWKTLLKSTSENTYEKHF